MVALRHAKTERMTADCKQGGRRTLVLNAPWLIKSVFVMRFAAQELWVSNRGTLRVPANHFVELNFIWLCLQCELVNITPGLGVRAMQDLESGGCFTA